VGVKGKWPEHSQLKRDKQERQVVYLIGEDRMSIFFKEFLGRWCKRKVAKKKYSLRGGEKHTLPPSKGILVIIQLNGGSMICS